MKITKSQQQAIHRLYQRSTDGAASYLSFRRRVQVGFDCLMLRWCGMWLGIEADGFTDS